MDRLHTSATLSTRKFPIRRLQNSAPHDFPTQRERDCYDLSSSCILVVYSSLPSSR